MEASYEPQLPALHVHREQPLPVAAQAGVVLALLRASVRLEQRVPKASTRSLSEEGHARLVEEGAPALPRASRARVVKVLGF